MIMGLRMRIYPTKEQEDTLLHYCKISHRMWNFLVAKYRDKLPAVTKFGIYNYRPCDLINEYGVKIPQRIAMGVIKNYAYAVKMVYNKRTKNVRFHKYNPNKQSFYTPSKTCDIINYSIKPPSHSSHMKLSKYISLDKAYIDKFNIKAIIEPRYTHLNGKWYLSGYYEKEDVLKISKKEMLGLDWGIHTFMTTSNGEFINYPPSVTREYIRVSKLYEILKTKKIGSKNYKKLNAKIFKAYERFENIKRDFIEKETTFLARHYHISIEYLKGFYGNHKSSRRSRMCFPRYKFINKLNQKCEKYGSYFIEVPSMNTTKRCCECGKLHDMPLSKRLMECDCGNVLDRDINAAINIANDGRDYLLSMGVCCAY